MSELTPENTWAAGMNFISICSGIEAASVAFGPLGWKAIAFSEIEPFPCAVLAHHYPDVPNFGDMTKFREWPEEIFADADAVVGGPPCQAFSVAGARNGLNDDRGNLTLTYAELINHADAIRFIHGKPPVVVLYENVPGLLSDKTGAFGCFLGGLAGEDGPLEPPGKRWTDAGCVFGPKRAVAWRLFDAQFFGLAQRRRRVFVVASARKGFDPATVLFEWDGLRRDTAPSREARQTAPTIPARSTAGGGLGTDFDCDGGTICVATGQAGAEIGADMAPTLNCNHEAPYVAHSLRGEGFDASEDGTGRGTPWVPVAMINMQGSKGNAVAQADGPSFTLNAMHGHDMHAVAVPVGVTIHGTDPTVQKVASYDELAQCLRARTPGNIDNSSTTVVQQPVAYGIRTANTSSNGWGIQEECTHTLDCAQGVAVAQPVAFDTTQITSKANRSNPKPGDPCHPLAAGAHAPAIAFNMHKSGNEASSLGISVDKTDCLLAFDKAPFAVQPSPSMQVRRLTPTEAERLQGFEPGYTAIPWRGKPADQCPDGPRYRALGNSWAVPNVRWIGQRIDAAVRRLR